MPIDLSDETVNKIVDRLITRGNQFKKIESEKELRNTKLLLKNYRLLRNHAEVELPKLEDDVPLTNSELSLYSLLGYRARSKEMIEFVNEILRKYKEICTNGTYEQRRTYKVIDALYLADERMTVNKLCKIYNVDESTIRRDVKRAVKELSVMIFGIDGLNDLSKW